MRPNYWEIEAHGVVRRVRLVPIAYERRHGREWYPVAELSSIEVQSTADRRRGRVIEETDMYLQDALLVDLEVIDS
jgi:hypothetical protein